MEEEGREGKGEREGGRERDLNADSVLPHNHGTVTCLPVVMAFINYIQAKYFHENSGVLCGLVHVPHASHVRHTSKLKMTSTDSQPHRSKHTQREGGGATYSHPVCAYMPLELYMPEVRVVRCLVYLQARHHKCTSTQVHKYTSAQGQEQF